MWFDMVHQVSLTEAVFFHFSILVQNVDHILEVSTCIPNYHFQQVIYSYREILAVFVTHRLIHRNVLGILTLVIDALSQRTIAEILTCMRRVLGATHWRKVCVMKSVAFPCVVELQVSFWTKCQYQLNVNKSTSKQKREHLPSANQSDKLEKRNISISWKKEWLQVQTLFVLASFCTRFVYFEMNVCYFAGIEWTDSIIFLSGLLHLPTHTFTSLSVTLGQTFWPVFVQGHCRLVGRCMSVLIVFSVFWTKFAATKMEDSKLMQRVEVRLLRIQGETVAEAHAELLRIHGAHALGVSTVCRWFHKFASADISVKKTGGYDTCTSGSG